MILNDNRHQKHSKLTRSDFGEYHRVELAILGAPCSEIQRKIPELTVKLSGVKLAYVDADHKAADEAENPAYTCWSSLTDKIVYRQFQSFSNYGKFDHQILFNDHDIVLVNGNHFSANAQIAVVHPQKLDSLQRKLERLTNVKMILIADGIDEIPSFLSNYLGASIKSIPVGRWNHSSDLSNIISEMTAPAPLKGIVLAGGKSSRMGKDKTIMEFHGKAQREFLLDLLDKHCVESFISCREEQLDELPDHLNGIADKFSGLGPYGAILSAFQQDPNAAWIVLASDLPLFDQFALDELVNARNHHKVATSFRSPSLGFPEPLVSLWEPRAYFHLLRFLGLGHSCPRKVLINTDCKVIEASRAEVLMNMNTPEDFNEIRKRLS